MITIGASRNYVFPSSGEDWDFETLGTLIWHVLLDSIGDFSITLVVYGSTP